ncbi:MAG: glycosyl hydrolase 53 family protein [Eubacterium sp.]|nr:glycosyl hydrolase 53 family protein [Eubacterium sp.]
MRKQKGKYEVSGKRILALGTAAALTVSLFGQVMPGRTVWAGDLPYGLQNGDFDSEPLYWDAQDSGFSLSNSQGNNTTNCLNLWTSATTEVSYSQTFLAPEDGFYALTYSFIATEGSSGLAFYANDVKLDDIEGTDWNDGNFTEKTADKTIYLKKDEEVDFEIKGTYSGWAAVDDITFEPIKFEEINGYEWVETDLIQNGGFEDGFSNWEIINADDMSESANISSNYEGNSSEKVLSIWMSSSEAVSYGVNQKVELEKGWYYLGLIQEGGDASKSGLSIGIDDNVMTISETELPATTGWSNWDSVSSDYIYIPADGEYSVFLFGQVPADAWGHIDDIKLYKYQENTEPVREFEFDTEIAEGEPVDTDDTGIYVEKLNVTKGFVTGADISSYASIIASGATFKDKGGRKLSSDEEFFSLLKESGVNSVRIRVWVDPKDEDDNYYGGGNCDLNCAKKLGKLATDAGMSVLIDFHYSDFWVDPGRQTAPKAWQGLSLEDKATTLKTYTEESLTALLEAGVDVFMVQIGNETTTGFCGESTMANMCTLFAAGSEGVRAVEEAKNVNIMIAVHLTNPEKRDFAGFARDLKNNGVIYDVFSTSYYPYWHGTLENLKSKLETVATTYDKYVMVTETSYVRTLEDGDGWENTEKEGKGPFAYDISEQGQVLHMKNLMETVLSIADNKGVGVYWWEPAWIPVQNYAAAEDKDAVLAANKQLWEEYGSGWATKFAAPYDANVGEYYGGSAVDNEGWFDFDGKAVASIDVYNMIRFGTTKGDYLLNVQDAEYAFVEGDDYQLPATVDALFASGEIVKVDATWDAEAVSDALQNGPGKYEIPGEVLYDKKPYDVTLNLTIKAENLLTNGSFESGENGWTITRTNTNDKVSTDDPYDGNNSFHFYNGNAQNFTVAQTVTLQPGIYEFDGFFQGAVGVSGNIYAQIGNDTENVLSDSFVLADWCNWQNPKIEDIVITEETDVTVSFTISYSAGAWGTCDYFTLSKTADLDDTEIITQPADTKVIRGSKAKFKVEAEGMDLTYKWQNSVDGETWVDSKAAGYDTNAISFKATDKLNGRYFRCIVTGLAGEVISEPAQLTTLAVISAQPKNAAAYVGDNAVFTFKSRSSVATFEWQISKDGGETWKKSGAEGCATTSLTVPVKNGSYNGYMFRCKVTNGTWVEYTNAVTLTVKPQITVQQDDVEAYYGDLVKLYIKVSGTAPTYQWQVQTVSGAWRNSTQAGNDTNILRFTSVTSLDGRKFRCKVVDNGITVYSNIVSFTAKSPIVTQPKSVSVKAGATAKFTAGVEVGNTENLVMNWQYSNDGGETWKYVKYENSGFDTQTLTLSKVAAAKSGWKFRLRVKNRTTVTYSDVVDLTVK